ncbi:hypothetical protein H6P81_003300 [Aristolochia fimbriata]|uniref:Uncharacterized protein n=1 Tax=Aristolochia fimbriata TaxID=158543 RepID=A0AAV7FGC3_ARIFI|nr:hypothetical protein H6P81_003300 [Aristolochia fimbriata]
MNQVATNNAERRRRQKSRSHRQKSCNKSAAQSPLEVAQQKCHAIAVRSRTVAARSRAVTARSRAIAARRRAIAARRRAVAARSRVVAQQNCHALAAGSRATKMLRHRQREKSPKTFAPLPKNEVVLVSATEPERSDVLTDITPETCRRDVRMKLQEADAAQSETTRSADCRSFASQNYVEGRNRRCGVTLRRLRRNVPNVAQRRSVATEATHGETRVETAAPSPEEAVAQAATKIVASSYRHC